MDSFDNEYFVDREPVHIRFEEDPIWAELTPDGLVWHIPLSRIKLEGKWGAYFNKEHEDG